jgi:hypothetical protein
VTPAPPPTPDRATIRWAASVPGVFWVGMDDASSRWAAAVSDGALRLEKRDHDGRLQWTGRWAFRGSYDFTAAVTPGGEPYFAANAPCEAADAGCGSSIDVQRTTHRGSVVVKLGTDGAVRWTRAMSGRLVGADVAGGTAVGWWRPPGTSSQHVTKLDAGGLTMWSKQITSTLALHLDRDGNVLATGCLQDETNLVTGIPCVRSGVFVTARIARDGTPLYTSQADGSSPAISSAADGTQYAAVRGGSPFVLYSFSPTGEVRWSRQFGANLLENQSGDPLLVAAAADGPVAVAGFGTSPPGPDGIASHPIVLGFDAGGTPTFTRKLTELAPAVAMEYGRDRELLLGVPGGLVEAPGGRVEGAMIVDLVP